MGRLLPAPGDKTNDPLRRNLAVHHCFDEGRQSTQLRWSSGPRWTAAVGHEDAFPPTTLSNRSRLGKLTSAGTHGERAVCAANRPSRSRNSPTQPATGLVSNQTRIHLPRSIVESGHCRPQSVLMQGRNRLPWTHRDELDRRPTPKGLRMDGIVLGDTLDSFRQKRFLTAERRAKGSELAAISAVLLATFPPRVAR